MQTINPLIFRAYDIRGIAEPTAENAKKLASKSTTKTLPDLTKQTAYLIGKATATYLIKNYDAKHMVVGRDMRNSSPDLQTAFIDGLLECGLCVTDVGLAPSPMIYFATCFEKYDFDCGANITASHNPKEYNGIKIVANLPNQPHTAHSICGDELQKILKIAQTGETKTPRFNKPKSPGHLEGMDIWPAYRDRLLQIIPKLDPKRKKPLKVIIDAGNGAAGPFIPELLRKIGAQVTELFCEPDGNFPNHEANPEELENMQALIKKVKSTKADIGIGFDGDGDRIGIIDELGNHYSADYFLLFLAKDLVTRHKKPKIVTDIKFSQAILNQLKALGTDPIMCKVGHSFIEQKVAEEGALIGGEVSGHMYFAEDYYGFDDAFLASAKILEVLSRSKKPFSAQFKDLPKTFMTPEFKAHCPDDKKFAIVKAITSHFTKRYDCITLDGVRVVFGPLAWGAIRASNTSPNLTLRFEAETQERLTEIQRIMYEEVRKHKEADLSWYKAI